MYYYQGCHNGSAMFHPGCYKDFQAGVATREGIKVSHIFSRLNGTNWHEAFPQLGTQWSVDSVVVWRRHSGLMVNLCMHDHKSHGLKSWASYHMIVWVLNVNWRKCFTYSEKHDKGWLQKKWGGHWWQTCVQYFFPKKIRCYKESVQLLVLPAFSSRLFEQWMSFSTLRLFAMQTCPRRPRCQLVFCYKAC